MRRGGGVSTVGVSEANTCQRTCDVIKGGRGLCFKKE